MSTSWRCWKVWAWNSLRVESSLMDTQIPSPSHASWRTWLSLRGWASNDFCKRKWEYADTDECKKSAGGTALLSGLSSKPCLVLWSFSDNFLQIFWALRNQTDSHYLFKCWDETSTRLKSQKSTWKARECWACIRRVKPALVLAPVIVDCIWSTKSSLLNMVFRLRILFCALISCAGTCFFLCWLVLRTN